MSNVLTLFGKPDYYLYVTREYDQSKPEEYRMEITLTGINKYSFTSYLGEEEKNIKRDCSLLVLKNEIAEGNLRLTPWRCK